MKIMYLTFFGIKDTKFLGVKKKILGQCKALEKLGNKVDVAYCSDNKLLISNKYNKKNFKCNRGITNYRRAVYKLFKEIELNYDLVYIRFPGSVDYYLYKLAKLLYNKKIKCILELPTYPIEGELKIAIKNFKNQKQYIKAIKSMGNYLLTMIFKRFIKNTGIKIVTYMPYDRIWNTETIVIDNGIDLEENRVIENYSTSEKQFNMTIVANLSKWHGIDRVLEGMKEYIEKRPNNERNVNIIIVGEGAADEELKQLVKKEKLEKYVTFKGMLMGKELNDVYNKTTIAIGSLGLHRIGLNVGSTLKVKEYCSKGIPFVISYKERELDNNFKFFKQVPATDEPLDIESCIEFFDNIKKCDYRNKMHQFAEKKYDWKTQMKNVLDKI